MSYYVLFWWVWVSDRSNSFSQYCCLSFAKSIFWTGNLLSSERVCERPFDAVFQPSDWLCIPDGRVLLFWYSVDLRVLCFDIWSCLSFNLFFIIQSCRAGPSSKSIIYYGWMLCCESSASSTISSATSYLIPLVNSIFGGGFALVCFLFLFFTLCLSWSFK